MSKNKIQSLLVEHLLKHGQIELVLPDGMTLEIGVTQENHEGDLVKKDDYCWIMASQQGRTASLDAYNMNLKFQNDQKTLILEDIFVDHNGDQVRQLCVV